MDNQQDLMLQLFRSNICKVDARRREFYANALLSHPGCLLSDLVLVFKKVPSKREEIASQILQHKELSPDLIVYMAQVHPRIAIQAEGKLRETKGANFHHFKRLGRVIKEHFPETTQTTSSHEDEEERKTNRHHYWWPHYHYKGKWRARIMKISVKIHQEYHAFFYRSCLRPMSRPCRSSLCVYSGLCCYWKSTIPFPEPSPIASEYA